MSSTTDAISITVQTSAMRGTTSATLSDIRSSITVGEVKAKLNVRANSRFGRSGKFENWDNRRSLSDYFVQNGEVFDCVIQCVIEEGQSSFDEYDQWLSEYK